MKYLVFMKQAESMETVEVRLNALLIASFSSEDTFNIGDVIHLNKESMIADYEPSPVKIIEVEHVISTGHILLSVSPSVSTQAQGEDQEGNPFIVTVPTIGQLVNLDEITGRRNNIVTILGSSRFHDEMIRVEKVLTLRGKVVMLHSPFTRNEHDLLSSNEFRVLSTTIEEKVRLSDEVVVVNPDGLIGESTGYAIEYAKEHGKKVTYYSDI